MGHFETPEQFFRNLDADVAGALIAATADVTLVMDEAGVIRDLAFGTEELLTHGYHAWLGKSWSETVIVESRPKVEALLRGAGSGNKPKWRHINHPSADGADLPLSYSVVPVHRKGPGARKGHTVLAQVRTNGRADTLRVRLADGGEEFAISVSLFRQENIIHFMLRLSALGAASQEPAASGKQMLLRVMESAPDAFVVTDLDGRILSVNHAFLDLMQLTSEELVRNESLEKWLGHSGVDLNVLVSNLRQSGAVRLFATTLRGEYGLTADVEISAVAVSSGEQPCLGFTIRDVGRRLTNDARTTRELPRSAGQMTELVGRVPLRDIVRETADLIEQLCIKAALELTHDNRASAAEMLNLSRQGLYVKLRRFGIGDALPEGEH